MTFYGGSQVREGEVLAGKYRIDRILGQGGMGVVVAAHHISLDEKVAIKFLLPEMLVAPEAAVRFAREARAAVKIKNEHVARVTDVGTLDNGAPYMVMEYLEGGDLAAWLQQSGVLNMEQAVDFMLQACEAIAEAHSLGIIHRDLKPANLFVTRRPDGALSVKVLDFGISKMTGPGLSTSQGSMTKTSTSIGSPLYMSPEQMQSSRDVDCRTDIWALGVILYELLAGTLPFIGDSLPELIARILSKPPEPLRDKRPDVPPGLQQVIFRCLERDRENRYESIAELARALLPFAPKRSRISVDRIAGVLKVGGLSDSTLSLPDSQNPQLSADPGTLASWGTTKRFSAHRATWVLIAAVVAAAAAAVFFWSKMSDAPTVSEPVPTVAAAPSQAVSPVVPEPTKINRPPPLVVEPAPPVPEPASTRKSASRAVSRRKTGLASASTTKPASRLIDVRKPTAKPVSSTPKSQNPFSDRK